jgi:hypothetical protein
MYLQTPIAVYCHKASNGRTRGVGRSGILIYGIVVCEARRRKEKFRVMNYE